MAVSCSAAPAVTKEDGAVTAIELKVAGPAVTERFIEPASVPCVAVIVTVPGFNPVIEPEELTDATGAEDVVQVTCDVKIAVLLSLYVPLAVNCRAEPASTEFAEAVTLMDTNVGVLVCEGEFCDFALLPPPQPVRLRQAIRTITAKLAILFMYVASLRSERAQMHRQYGIHRARQQRREVRPHSVDKSEIYRLLCRYL
jgi:hypothetical protein